jgi:hypothetical protein
MQNVQLQADRRSAAIQADIAGRFVGKLLSYARSGACVDHELVEFVVFPPGTAFGTARQYLIV